MLLSKEQLSSVMSKHSERENGLHDLMEIMIESMMLAELREFLDHAESNKGNGFRHGRAFGQGRVLEFRIPQILSKKVCKTHLGVSIKYYFHACCNQ